MLTIHKLKMPSELRPGEYFQVPIPRSAKILDVQTQFGLPVFWVLLDTDHHVGPGRDFVLFETGHNLSGCNGRLDYAGTFQVNGGTFVFHLFEVLL